jgi:hypothetical protein
MEMLSYGFSTPEDLFAKLKRDGAKFGKRPDPDDVFNFLVTAAALNEWVRKVFKGDRLIDDIAQAVTPSGKWEKLPTQTIAWVADSSCVPNRHCDVRRHIFNALRICWDVAGASKHFYWSTAVKGIDSKPIVGNWYQYFFTSVTPDLYVDYEGEVYGLSQVRDILTQFYAGLFKHVGNGHVAT